MKTLAVLTILATIAATSFAAVDTGKLTVNYADGTSDTVTGVKHGNGAISYDAYGTDDVVSATLTINGQTINWNGKNGAENAGLPEGFKSAAWHWVYTKSGILTISHVTGKCPSPPCEPPVS